MHEHDDDVLAVCSCLTAKCNELNATNKHVNDLEDQLTKRNNELSTKRISNAADMKYLHDKIDKITSDFNSY